MPINPAYSAGEIPAPPTPQAPSPLSDAFQVLASYIEGENRYKQKAKADEKEMLKTYLDMGAMDVDLSGGLSAPKYTPIPMAQRPAYMEAAGKKLAYEASAIKDLAEAGSYSSGQTGTVQAGSSMVRAKSMFDAEVAQLSRQDKLRLKQQAASPLERQRMKDGLVRKYKISAVDASRWIEEAINAS